MMMDARAVNRTTSVSLPKGYTDLAPGKLANVVTCLEMREWPAPRPEPPDLEATLVAMRDPDPAWYRALFRRVGEPYLWFSRLALSDDDLVRIISDPRVDVSAVRVGGEDIGLLELDFRVKGECELVFFGLVRSAIGKGLGRWLMNRALQTITASAMRRPS
jgi:GNAT superfamily N-acetyltransferase